MMLTASNSCRPATSALAMLLKEYFANQTT